MFRTGVVLLCLVFITCKSKKKSEKDETGFSYEKFDETFKTVTAPYGLADTALLNNKDTAIIRSTSFSAFLSDSLKTKIFGKGSKLRYIALAKMKGADKTVFYFIKASSGSKKAALLYAFDNGQFSAVFPFLAPDNNPLTSQSTGMDKQFTITKSIIQKQPPAEGKDVFEYMAASKQFSLILTEPLNKKTGEVINPIDTFSRKHKFAGDYVKDKINFVSVRDGRSPNQLLVFINLNKDNGGCTGELKGDMLFTSSNTAVYSQGGDPCKMTFRFSASSVSVIETEGCGSHRQMNCSFDGTYTKKKTPKPKTTSKKKTNR